MNWREWRPLDIEVTQRSGGTRSFDLVIRWDRMAIIALVALAYWWWL